MPQSLRNNKIDSITTQLIDFHKRRITNAAPAINSNDYVIKQQLTDAIASINVSRSTSVSSTTAGPDNNIDVSLDDEDVVY